MSSQSGMLQAMEVLLMLVESMVEKSTTDHPLTQEHQIKVEESVKNAYGYIHNTDAYHFTCDKNTVLNSPDEGPLYSMYISFEGTKFKHPFTLNTCIKVTWSVVISHGGHQAWNSGVVFIDNDTILTFDYYMDDIFILFLNHYLKDVSLLGVKKERCSVKWNIEKEHNIVTRTHTTTINLEERTSKLTVRTWIRRNEDDDDVNSDVLMECKGGELQKNNVEPLEELTELATITNPFSGEINEIVASETVPLKIGASSHIENNPEFNHNKFDREFQ